MIQKIKKTLIIDYEMSIDSETNEIVDMKVVKINPVGDKKEKKEDVIDESKPKLYLYDNTYRLTDAAIKLMGVKAGDKLVIIYDDDTPVIGINTAFKVGSGNKLSKKNTVPCRGLGNSNLSKYGKEFRLEPTKDAGIFALTSNNMIGKKMEENNEKVPEPEHNPLDDLDLSNEGAKLIIDSDFFKL